MSSATVGEGEGPLAGPLAEVWAQVEDRRHGRIGYDGGAVSVGCHWDGAGWAINEVDL